MREILDELERWRAAGEDIALATLVRVRGSAPRLPGARLALTRSGKLVGSVSGGCVENAVLERGRAVLDEGRPALVCYGIEDEPELGVGLSCGGTIDVLVAPFAADATFEALCHGLGAREPVATAVVLAPEPALGRTLVVRADRTTVGAIDPALDAAVAARGRALAEDGGTDEIELAIAGGTLSIFLQGFPPRPALVIVGATHTAVPLCRLATTLDFHVTIVDPRRAYATRDRFPEADDLVCAWPETALAGGLLDRRSFLVTLSHDPKLDLPALAHGLRAGVRYLGALGSRRTHAERRARLADLGLDPAAIDRIHAPVGLDLGGRAPAEIALAILAEMQAVRHAKETPAGTGRPAREVAHA